MSSYESALFSLLLEVQFGFAYLKKKYRSFILYFYMALKPFSG